MKMGSLLVGGIAGAALAIIVQRSARKAGMAGDIGHRMKQRMSGAKEDAIGKLLNIKFASSSGRDHDLGGNQRSQRQSETTSRDSNSNVRRAADQSSNNGSRHSQDHSEPSSHAGEETFNFDKLAQLASSDSEVKRQVNEILEQSGQNQI